MIELNGVQEPYLGLFTSPTGETGLTRTALDGVDLGLTVNAFPKISLLGPNFERMQQITAAFGLSQQWREESLETLSVITRQKVLALNPDLEIDLDAKLTLSATSLTDLQAAFIIHFLVLGMSVLVLICEKALKRL